MKLIFAVIQDDDCKPLMRELIHNNFSVTRISSSGGFLHRGNSTLMIGVEQEQLEKILGIIEEKSQRRKTTTVVPSHAPSMDFVGTPVEVVVGGATVFIVDVEQSFKY